MRDSHAALLERAEAACEEAARLIRELRQTTASAKAAVTRVADAARSAPAAAAPVQRPPHGRAA